MLFKKPQACILFTLLYFTCTGLSCYAQTVKINNNETEKKVTFGNDRLTMTLDYGSRATISSMVVNGQAVIENTAGIYSAIRTKEAAYSTLKLLSQPELTVTDNSISLGGIIYGDNAVTINETWTFTVNANNIAFGIERTLTKPIVAVQSALPAFMFNSISTWEGAYQDYGGLAWFYLFNKKLDTYGVYSSSSQFWNSKTGDGLTVSVSAPGKQVAMDYSRTSEDRLACNVTIAQNQITPRLDADTHRRLFIRDSTDVWAPVAISAGKTTQQVTLAWFDFNKVYGRGNFVGINGKEVSAVLNTIARIGVIGKQHFGGNSWHTPYGPICLHEQYIAQMGLAINDKKYLDGYRECLDYYRNNAIKPDGRVFSRWAYSNEDAMPGGFNDKGFYEAQWGYLMDANPDYVTNVAELYDQIGDLSWVKTQQAACEKALDWIIKRDSNNNGLVEMMTDSHKQKKGSDWIDIIWASYENVFVNAKLYRALVLWADIEKQLGNTPKEKFYQQFAIKLKNNFNKPVAAGGFWDDKTKCYIHWRDKDGSIHGNNMVTPINFMAIAYGICDDEERTKTILDDIEVQMQKEQLFFWPICMSGYKEGEGNDWQFPFPNYENGDIFLSWGAVAVKAYAAYKPELALKYVKNVLAQYAKDGLAFQRYGRTKQDGLGDDILSGNSLSVVGLYQAIYGVNPKYNRLYLEPHITSELAGTQLRYNYRNQQLLIDLSMDQYAISNGRFRVISNANFGFFNSGDHLKYFAGSSNKPALEATTKSAVTIEIKSYAASKLLWMQTSGYKASVIAYRVNELVPNQLYRILINGRLHMSVKSNAAGSLNFTCGLSKGTASISVVRK